MEATQQEREREQRNGQPKVQRRKEMGGTEEEEKQKQMQWRTDERADVLALNYVSWESSLGA